MVSTGGGAYLRHGHGGGGQQIRRARRRVTQRIMSFKFYLHVFDFKKKTIVKNNKGGFHNFEMSAASFQLSAANI
jgi:hypothetical protein